MSFETKRGEKSEDQMILGWLVGDHRQTKRGAWSQP